MKQAEKTVKRNSRKRRVRAKVFGTALKPRLAVFKSNTRLTAQLIDDEAEKTLAAVSSAGQKEKTPRERAQAAGTHIAEAAKKLGVTKVVFDRSGFMYAGSVKAFADSARAAGLQF